MTDHKISGPKRVSTTAARDQLSGLITYVQQPDTFVVLTRHGVAHAALISTEMLGRVWSRTDIDAVIAGTYRPGSFTFGKGGWPSNRHAAEAVQRLQLNRRVEREVLAQAGLAEVPGGELREEVRIRAPVRFWPLALWWRVRGWFG